MTEPENPLLPLARTRLHTVIDGKWQLEDVLGVGGMAAVFAARHRNGKRVAIKLLHPHLAVMPQVVQRFVREGYAANLVEHPGAVSVLDDGLHEGVPFLVMELLEGETADARCDRLGRGIALPDALAIADAVLAVLEAGHKRGMVHRDIKPENIFITSDGETKVLDFGIARIDEVAALGASSTQSGSSLGTPAFMPPEQARGERAAVDARTDLWSLGASLFFMVSGQFVHDVETVSAMLVQTMTRQARSLGSAAPHVPREVVEVVDRALAFQPEDRWPSAAAFREALREAARGAGIFVPPRPSAAGYVPPPPPPRSAFASASATGAHHAMLARPGSSPEFTETRISPDTPPSVEEADFAPPRASRRAVVGAILALAAVVLVAAAISALNRSDAAPASASTTAPAAASSSPPHEALGAPAVEPASASTAPPPAPEPPKTSPPKKLTNRPPVAPPPTQPPPRGTGRRDLGESRN